MSILTLSRDSQRKAISSLCSPDSPHPSTASRKLVPSSKLPSEFKALNVPKLISCNERKREVFGPKSQQRSIYDQAIAPIVNEVLEGFNSLRLLRLVLFHE
ncbi:hypothetical protein GH714_012876 [Hevea brasiliensis]|uniref:Uncharacterized protein n=1 Tax=Hevea brasiliensis TaxID=3981 RepID=A0A6A6M0G0_HEVBR|nr:hypothetical protein GH714_012876 [Hevea brasiliensis]